MPDKFNPTESEIHAYISAWDGDIDEKTARYLLEIAFWEAENERLKAENKVSKEFIDFIYEQEPSLKKEGLDGFDGYFVHWDVIVRKCMEAWPEGHHYDESPLELIVDLNEERDEALAEIERLKEKGGD